MNSKLKQTTIFSAMNNWRSLAQKKRVTEFKMRKIVETGVIDLTLLDSDSDSENQHANDRTVVITDIDQKPVLCIGVNKPKASSTPRKLQDCSALKGDSSDSTIILEDSDSEGISIVQNISIKPVSDEQAVENRNNAENRHGSTQPSVDDLLDRNNNSENDSQLNNRPSPSTSAEKENSSPNKQTREKKSSSHTMISSYLTDINYLLKSVNNSPSLKSLIEPEKPILNKITTADAKYFFVCVKFCIWIPKWYNIFRFCQDIKVELEKKEIIKLYEFLKINELVDVDIYKDDLPTLLNDISKAELLSVCKRFKIKVSKMKKQEIRGAILKYSDTQSTLLKKSSKDLLMEELKNRMGFCVKVKASFREAFYNVYTLGTFACPAFSFINQYFKDIRTNAFPQFDVEDYVVFYSRQEFLSYVSAKNLRDTLEDTKVAKNHSDLLQISRTAFQRLKSLEKNGEGDEDRYRAAPHLKRFTAESVYVSCLTKLAEKLFAKFPDEVKVWLKYLIKNYPNSHRVGVWYNKLTWLYIKYLKPNDHEHTARLIKKYVITNRDNISDVQLHEMSERVKQLKGGRKREVRQVCHDTLVKLLPHPIDAEDFPSTTVDAEALRSKEIGRKRKYVIRDTDGSKTFRNVEQIALTYYTERCGYTGGRHCEASLVTATFVLFFWDITYRLEKTVPGAFVSPLQFVPLDMKSGYFYRNRKDAIDKRLREIEEEWEDEKVVGFLRGSWELHGHERGLCQPDSIVEDVEFLGTLVECVGRKVLAKIYERLVKNIGLYRRGMPDLLLWEVENKKCKFVEVKGENDRLSIEQKLWLKYLISIGANVEVCHVNSIGSNIKTGKKKVVAKKVAEKKA